MRPLQLIALAILIPFTLLSVYAVSKVGYIGIFTYHLHSPAGWQVFTDLVIAIFLLMSWMIHDGRKRGRVVWPYLLISLFLGSFGPLLYIIMGPRKSTETVST